MKSTSLILVTASMVAALSASCSDDKPTPVPSTAATSATAKGSSTAAASASGSALATATATATAAAAVPIQLSADFKAKVSAVHEAPAAPSAQDRGTLIAHAWNLFLSAVQGTSATTADGTGRETPTASAAVTGQKPLYNDGNNPLIFEAFYHRTEAYPYYTTGQRPAAPPYKAAPVYRFKPLEKATTGFTVTGGQYVNLDENNEIGQNMMYYKNSNDPNFPVLYMAKVNHTEVQYVWDQKAVPSTTASYVFPDGTMEIKAAWRRVKDIKNSDPNSYHQAKATYYVGPADKPEVKTELFALIAIHIIQKSADHKTFFFSTFEHKDALTRASDNTITDPAYHLAYQTLAYDPVAPTHVAKALGATTDINSKITGENIVTSYTLPAAGPQVVDATITQPQTITSEVVTANAFVSAVFSGTVWANYRLKGVQGAPVSDETTADYFLANIVVESSQPGIQLFRGGVSPVTASFTNSREKANISLGLVDGKPVPAPQYTMGGCMGCHGVAEQRGQDFVFLASGAVGVGKSVDVTPTGDMKEADREAQNKRVVARRNQEIQ
jgi:hypothetical protein